MFADGPWLAVALGLYLASALTAVAELITRRNSFRVTLALLIASLVVHSIAIGARWDRLGHGPFVNLFEILSSNVWSLHLVVLLACLAIRRIRPMLAAILPVLQVLVIWHLIVPAPDTHLPVTYTTFWLGVHVAFGKMFLGCLVVAVGLSLVVLARQVGVGRVFDDMPPSIALDELAYRFILVSFIFESLMLIAGAIWAQDAWGRYWAWDPLETWAFITWLSVAVFLHLRARRRPSPAVAAGMILLVFGVAFSTFFGIPFISTAPHKGAI